MKFGFLTAMVFGVMVALAPMDAEAKRFGGGKSSGMQRAAPAKPTPTAPAAAPNPGPGAGAAATPKRSWMGPIAGLAAGLGLAALFSHLGMGEGLANFVMMALLAVVAFVAIRFVMRRLSGNRGPALATAGAGAGPGMRTEARDAAPNAMARSSFQPAATPSTPGHTGLVIGSALGGAASAATPSSLPADFDAEGFGRIAKMIFIRMQAANDSADLNDLRTFTTPELFASLRMDLLERGDQGQQTDVIGVDATVLDYAEDNGQQIVSVRFEGSLREQAGAEPTAFDEVWHLVKPTDAEGAWRIAGVQQQA